MLKTMGLCTVMLLVGASAHASKPAMKTIVKNKVATEFGVAKTGISVTMQPKLQVQPARRFRGRVIPQKVKRFIPSKTIDQFFAIVPAAPARAGFTVTGTIRKSTGSILGMHRDGQAQQDPQDNQ